ncbi:MAG: hypothetical protein ACOYD5_09605, partial [Negativicutes bacterium]
CNGLFIETDCSASAEMRYWNNNKVIPIFFMIHLIWLSLPLSVFAVESLMVVQYIVVVLLCLKL